MGNFIFKTIKPTGKWKSFQDDETIIKFEKKEVGNIDSNKPHRIRLMAEKGEMENDPNPNCSWRWVTLAKDFESIDEAKEFIKDKKDIILNKYVLHKLEE